MAVSRKSRFFSRCFSRCSSWLINLLYPSNCPLCGGPSNLYELSPICSVCFSGIKRFTGPSCAVCGEAFGSELGHICGRCIKEPPPFKRAASYGLYTDDALREAIHLLKFSGIKRLSKPLGMLLSGIELPSADLIVPVPVSARSLRARGFNHSALMGKTVSKRLGIPLLVGVLYKKKDTPPQVGLTRAERLENLRGAFGMRERLNGQKVLLIDDVLTTGATARECSKTLLKGGADEVYVATAARSVLL